MRSEITNSQRADVLIQALPYIKKYYNKILVVKYGGNAMINDELKEAVMGDIVLLSPACAAFDMFKNFAERGRYFKEIVMEL